MLRTLTRKGMIVVCSIHQPRSNIFSEFDKVLLLNKGKTVYYGARSSIVTYFQDLGKLLYYAVDRLLRKLSSSRGKDSALHPKTPTIDALYPVSETLRRLRTNIRLCAFFYARTAAKDFV